MLKATRICFPASDFFLLIGLLTMSILFRYPRCGLVIAYVFAFRWCWSLVEDYSVHAQISYMIFGIMVGALAVIGMLQEKHQFG